MLDSSIGDLVIGSALGGYHWPALILVNAVAFGVPWLARRKRWAGLEQATGEEPRASLGRTVFDVVAVLVGLAVMAIALLLVLELGLFTVWGLISDRS